jgi:uncharacterized membrane protein
MAPLQKRAWWGLGVGLAFTIAFVLVFFLMGGIESFDTDSNFRLIINVLWIGGLVANLVIMELTLRKPGMVDERDRMIRDRASRAQWLATIFALAAWVAVLNEVYQETGLIPAVYLYVIFMSVLIVSTLAQCLGIAIGYWRANRNA